EHARKTAERLGWEIYAADAAAAGLGLEAMGVAAGDAVAIAAGNRPEWLVADLGIQGIGAVTVGVYPTSPAAEVSYVLSHSRARVVVCEDEEQLDKVLEVRAALPDLLAAVARDGEGGAVAAAMRRGCPGADATEPMAVALRRMQESTCATIPVLRDGRLAGLLTLDNLSEYLSLRDARRRR
ncbi:MAG: AMP-binding protein, partial [Vicinamibacteria bacterium]